MPIYNTTTIVNPSDILVNANSFVGGFLGLAFVGVFFVVLFKLFSDNNKYSNSFMGSSFFAFILSVILRSLDLLGDKIVSGVFALLILGIMWSWLDR